MDCCPDGSFSNLALYGELVCLGADPAARVGDGEEIVAVGSPA